MSFFSTIIFKFFLIVKKFFIGSPCITCKSLETSPFHHVCKSCSQHITLIKDHSHCPRCSNVLNDTPCSNCVDKDFFWQQLHCIFYQKDPVIKEIFYQYKFHNSLPAEQDFVRLIRPHLEPFRDYTIILVPCSKATKKRLSFHPVARILTLLDIPYHEIFDKNESITMKHLSGSHRKNLESPFQIRTKNSSLRNIPQQSKILIIDDVMTTGTSLNHIAHSLHELNFQHIEAFCFLRS